MDEPTARCTARRTLFAYANATFGQRRVAEAPFEGSRIAIAALAAAVPAVPRVHHVVTVRAERSNEIQFRALSNSLHALKTARVELPVVIDDVLLYLGREEWVAGEVVFWPPAPRVYDPNLGNTTPPSPPSPPMMLPLLLFFSKNNI